LDTLSKFPAPVAKEHLRQFVETVMNASYDEELTRPLQDALAFFPEEQDFPGWLSNFGKLYSSHGAEAYFDRYFDVQLSNAAESSDLRSALDIVQTLRGDLATRMVARRCKRYNPLGPRECWGYRILGQGLAFVMEHGRAEDIRPLLPQVARMMGNMHADPGLEAYYFISHAQRIMREIEKEYAADRDFRRAQTRLEGVADQLNKASYFVKKSRRFQEVNSKIGKLLASADPSQFDEQLQTVIKSTSLPGDAFSLNSRW
jgi:hypothetical protein